MKKSDTDRSVTKLEQLRQLQKINKLQLSDREYRLSTALNSLQSSLTIGNMLLSALNDGTRLLQGITIFRRGYRLMTKFFKMFRRQAWD